ncbi:hypothetical protein EV1_039954 [Malus domestica]
MSCWSRRQRRLLRRRLKPLPPARKKIAALRSWISLDHDGQGRVLDLDKHAIIYRQHHQNGFNNGGEKKHVQTLKEILTRRPVAATICLIVPVGAARPVAPVGSALGQYKLNLMAFCKDFNGRTQKYKPDTPMAVIITAFKDNTFEFTMRSLSVTWYLKKAAGIESGSSRPGHAVTSTLSVRHVYEIAKVRAGARESAYQRYDI